MVVSNIYYGFVSSEYVDYFDTIEIMENVQFTNDESMFMFTWIQDTPKFLVPYLQIVVDNEEQANQILSGEL